jgi:hypothetical protein
MKDKQTAVDWVIKQINNKSIGDGDYRTISDVFNQAKQMEKEQIMKAFSRNYMYPDDIPASEKYYNETYGK